LIFENKEDSKFRKICGQPSKIVKYSQNPEEEEMPLALLRTPTSISW